VFIQKILKIWDLGYECWEDYILTKGFGKEDVICLGIWFGALDLILFMSFSVLDEFPRYIKKGFCRFTGDEFKRSEGKNTFISKIYTDEGVDI